MKRIDVIPLAACGIGLALCATALTACATAPAAETSGKTITIGTLSWEESLAVTAVWENVLESEGYTVEIKQLDAGPAYQALSTGQIDVFSEQWPNYFKDFMEKYEEDIETIGTWYEGTDINLAVPDYVEQVNSLADLADNADLFGNRIIGIESGSETMKLLESTVAPGYGLDAFKVEASSTPAMIASLEDAIADKKPIVVTLWRPHWAFTKYPIKALEDPQELFGGTGVIQSVANKGFGERQPEAEKILSNFKLSSEQLGELELAIQAAGKGNITEGVRNWIEKNQDLVDSWTGS